MKGPAPRPCESCPYRQDVPSGVWDASEYRRLAAYDRPTQEQPIGMFACHQQDGRVCAGWVGCHDMTHTLAVRVGASSGALDDDTVDAILDYVSPVPLHDSGTAAGAHGMRDVYEPGEDARRLIDKISRRRGLS